MVVVMVTLILGLVFVGVEFLPLLRDYLPLLPA